MKVDLPEPEEPITKTNLAALDLQGHLLEGGALLARVRLADVLEANHGCITSGSVVKSAPPRRGESRELPWSVGRRGRVGGNG